VGGLPRRAFRNSKTCVCLGDFIGNIDIETLIKAFAKARRIKPSEFKQFREQILNGMKAIGLDTKEVDMNKFNEIAKQKR
jgi:hypothetical protein